MDIKKKLQDILAQADQRLTEKPNILGMADYPSTYNYLVAKIESLIEFMSYEDVLMDIVRGI